MIQPADSTTATPRTPTSETPSQAREGRLMALLGYVTGIVALVSFVQRNNAFAFYHAKQALTMYAAAVAAQIVLMVLGMVLVAVKLGLVSMVLGLLFLAALLALVVIGSLNAWNGRRRPLPVIGTVAERMFRGLASQ